MPTYAFYKPERAYPLLPILGFIPALLIFLCLPYYPTYAYHLNLTTYTDLHSLPRRDYPPIPRPNQETERDYQLRICFYY